MLGVRALKKDGRKRGMRVYLVYYVAPRGCEEAAAVAFVAAVAAAAAAAAAVVAAESFGKNTQSVSMRVSSVRYNYELRPVFAPGELVKTKL